MVAKNKVVIDCSNVRILEYIKKIDDEVNFLKNNLKDNCLIAYRAEDKDYGDGRFKPSIFRNQEVIIKDIELNTKNILMDYGFISHNENSLYYPIEAQHYGLKSRLTDITFNALVALYFVASNPNNLGDDGIIYVFGFPKYFSPNDSNLSQLYQMILEGKKTIVDRNFKVLTHCRANDRIKAQNGGFILFLGDEFNRIPDVYYRKVPVKKEHYKEILESLKTLFGIVEYNIYPEEDKMKTVPYDRKILYSNEFKSQISEYIERLTFEVNCTKGEEDDEERKKRLRMIRAGEDYLNGMLNKYDDKNDKEAEVIREAIKQLYHLKIINGGGK